jgi:hypothetical protein
LAIASAYVSPVPGLDERITERGWVFDEELSDEESVLGPSRRRRLRSPMKTWCR